MIIKKIYVNTYAGDVHWCYLCLTSIRYWYRDIEIVLIKDLNNGDFDTSLIQRTFNASLFESKATFGWGYGKLEPLFLESKESFLILDSDTVIVGDVLSTIKDVQVDFIVDAEVQPEKRFNEIYYDRSLIKDVNGSFKALDFSFNTGQWFGTSGIISRKEFDSTIEWRSPRINKYPHIIKNGEQGHVNYHFHRLYQDKKINIECIKIMNYPLHELYSPVNLSTLQKKESQGNAIVHWAGIKNSLFFIPEKFLICFFLNKLKSEVGYVNYLKIYFKFVFPK